MTAWGTYGLEKFVLKPDYPQILTPKDWEKKKGAVAKLALGRTDIGAECDKLMKAYAKVPWTQFDLREQIGKKLGSWGGEGGGANFTMANWNKLLQSTAQDMNKHLVPLSKQAYALRDLCKKVAVDAQKSKVVPAATGKHLLEMAKAADFFGVGLNQNTTSGKLTDAKKIVDAYVAKMYGATGPWKAAVGNHKDAVKKMRALYDKDQLDATKYNAAAKDATRGLTQPIGNYMKAVQRGWLKPAGNLVGIYQQLTAWSNNDSYLPLNANKQAIGKAIDDLEVVFNKAITINL